MTTDVSAAPEVPAIEIASVETAAAKMRRELNEQLEAEQAKLRDKYARKVREADEADSREALQSKLLEITEERRGFYSALVETLGLQIPDSGLIFDDVITITRASDGAIMVSVTKPETKTVTRGTRSPNGSGTNSRTPINANTIPGFTGYVLANGTITKIAKDAVTALGGDPGKMSAAEYVVGMARKDKDKANTIKVIVSDVQTPLGDFVAARFPVTAAATPATPTTSEAPAITPAPAPVA